MSLVQSDPVRVLISHSHVASVPWGWSETVTAPLASRPTRTSGDDGGTLSSHGDAGTSASLAYGPATSFSGRPSFPNMTDRMLKKTLPVAPRCARVAAI